MLNLIDKSDKHSSLLKVILAIFCLTGFLFQITELLLQFTSGRTVVNLEIGQAQDESLPALTVCPSQPALNKLAMISQHIHNQFNDYLSLLSLKDEGHNVETNITEVEEQIQNNMILFINNQTLDSYDLLKHYFAPYDQVLEIYLIRSLSNGDSEAERKLLQIEQGRLFNPFVSGFITYENITGTFGFYNCFTFFSHLDLFWKMTRFDFFKITMHLHLNTTINYYTSGSYIDQELSWSEMCKGVRPKNPVEIFGISFPCRLCRDSPSTGTLRL